MEKPKYLIGELKLLFFMKLSVSTLICLCLLNSNSINEKKSEAKMKGKQFNFFKNIKSKRKLEIKSLSRRKLSNDDESSFDASEEFCSNASDELNQYYISGDSSKLDIDDEPIKCTVNDKNFMENLSVMARDYLFDETEKDDSENSKINEFTTFDSERSTLLNAFFIISLSGVLYYIICLINACCNCCCC